MNFGGLIALQKQQKKESGENKIKSPENVGKSKSKKGDSHTDTSGENDKLKVKSKHSKQKQSPEQTVGYMKDISKINQDIENIKQRGVNKAVNKIKDTQK